MTFKESALSGANQVHVAFAKGERGNYPQPRTGKVSGGLKPFAQKCATYFEKRKREQTAYQAAKKKVADIIAEIARREEEARAEERRRQEAAKKEAARKEAAARAEERRKKEEAARREAEAREAERRRQEAARAAERARVLEEEHRKQEAREKRKNILIFVLLCLPALLLILMGGLILPLAPLAVFSVVSRGWLIAWFFIIAIVWGIVIMTVGGNVSTTQKTENAISGSFFCHIGVAIVAIVLMFVSLGKLEGQIYFVETATQLKGLSGLPDDADIVLNADVDLGGDKLPNFFEDFTGTFKGNHHTISNFTLDAEEEENGLFTGILGSITDLNLKNVSFTTPEGLTCKGDFVIEQKGTNLQVHLSIDKKTIEIYEGTFRNCKGLTSVSIPDGVETISYGLFRGCTSLTAVTIGKGVTKIQEKAFENCNITEVYISNLKAWCEMEYPYKYTSLITKDGITLYLNGKELEGELFLPDTITKIASNAFKGCTKITSVVIPESVTTIGYSAFDGCSQLATIYCEADSQPYGWASSWTLGSWNSGCSAQVVWGYND